MENFSITTGLTPQQEKAAIFLASGKTMTETAKELKVERSTLYQWSIKSGFKAYFNSLVADIRENTKTALYGLIEDAYKTLRESLNSKNESVKLKAALSIIDRIKDVEIGNTDPVKMIREQCTHTFDFDVDFSRSAFDEDRFEKLMQENHLTE